MTDREEFLQIFRQHVTRPGSEKLLDWLDHKTDFFSAPASTRFHGACTGGLCMHSLNVYHALHDTFFTEGESEESFAICALLHDLCKANYYKAGTRNVKNETTGQWEKVPSYSVEDLFPYGHGEKIRLFVQPVQQLFAARAGDVLLPDVQKLCAVAPAHSSMSSRIPLRMANSSWLREMPLPMRVPSGDQSRMSYLGSPSFQLIRFS